MRACAHVLAVVAFLTVALIHVRMKVRRDGLAYEIGRQRAEVERLERRAEVLDCRVRSKYDPITVHSEILRRRRGPEDLTSL